MPRRNVLQVYEEFSASAAKLREIPTVSVPENSPASEKVKPEDSLNRELRDAMLIGQHFSENRVKDGYVLKEGWDLFDIIDALVVLYHFCKNNIIHKKDYITDEDSDE